MSNRVRIAEDDIPFKKGYEQSFTDEIFTITKVVTFNPPAYRIIDEKRETIKRIFTSPN